MADLLQVRRMEGNGRFLVCSLTYTPPLLKKKTPQGRFEGQVSWELRSWIVMIRSAIMPRRGERFVCRKTRKKKVQAFERCSRPSRQLQNPTAKWAVEPSHLFFF